MWLAPIWDPRGDRFYFTLDGALWRTFLLDGHTAEMARVANRDISSMIWSSDGPPVDDRTKSINGCRRHNSQEKEDGFYRIDLSHRREYETLGERGVFIRANGAFRMPALPYGGL